MVDIQISGLWRGQPVAHFAHVELERNLDEQQKQVARLTAQCCTDSDMPEWGPQESAVDFATRLGFTKLDYQYHDGDQSVIVDVLDPSKAI
jgi:hypothetical protein